MASLEVQRHPGNKGVNVTAKYQAIALIGAPGTGKGTQGKILGDIPGFYLYGSGDAFRALEPESPLGRRVHEYMRQGELVPDEVVIDVWQDQMRGAIATDRFHPERDFLVLDGMLRTPEQVPLVQRDADLVQVFHLVCHEEQTLVQRVHGRAASQHRADDVDEQVIRHRLELHNQATRTVLAELPPEVVSEIDACLSPMEVLRQMLNVLIPLQKRVFG